MSVGSISLWSVYEGWEGYNISLIHAVEPLSPEQLAWRPAPGMRPAGEVAAHIGLGRIDWFNRMDAPGAAELASRAPDEDAIANDAGEIVRWLQESWRMIESVLKQWTVDDLPKTYPQPYQGNTYAVSRQWTIWRIMA